MEISEAVEFVRRNHRGVLAVTRADGKPQMSPVTGAVNRDGLVVVSSRETAYKVRSVRARPYAAYCGFADQFFGQRASDRTSARDTPCGGPRWSATSGC